MALENTRLQNRLSGNVLTPDEVAKILKVSKATVIRRFRDGTIPAKLIGKKWRCRAEALDEFFKAA
jgi:excisionase family DNA binding protein